MSDSDRLARFLQTTFQDVGRQYQEARHAFVEARREAAGEETTRRIVCRRYAERREVLVGSRGRPDCFETGHPDCEGCVEDLRAGRIETW